MKTGMKGFSGVILAAGLLSGTVWAQGDFAPLKVGNEWVYQGRIVINRFSSLDTAVKETETLRIKVLSSSRKGDTLRYMVSMRDSLSDRQRMTPDASGKTILLKDTVIHDTRTWLSVGDRLTLLKEIPDSSLVHYPYPFIPNLAAFSLFQEIPLFTGHAALPGAPRPVPGATGGVVLETGSFPSENRMTSWNGWYIRGIGMFWAKNEFSYGAACGPGGHRELLLRTFNGKPVDIGVLPPGAPLAKEAKASCSSLRRKASRQFFPARTGRTAFNALGRLESDRQDPDRP